MIDGETRTREVKRVLADFQHIDPLDSEVRVPEIMAPRIPEILAP
jgi:hypothetical protein